MKKFKFLSILFFLTFAVSIASAGEPYVYFDGDPHYIHHFPDPVNLKNGNLYLPATDIFFSSGNTNLNFLRFYNSRQSQKESPLGYGWRHNYMTKLSEPVTGAIKVEESDGYITYFNPTVGLKTKLADKITAKRKTFEKKQGKIKSAKYYAKFREKMIKDTSYLFEMHKIYFPGLSDYAYGSYYSSQRNSQIIIKTKSGFERRYPDGHFETFNKDGNIIRIQDRYGNFIGLEYRAKRLRRVFDKNGLSLKLAYNAKDMIANVKDPMGRTFSYIYDKNSNLAKTVGFRGETEKFYYNKLHKITGITLADKGRVKIKYDKKMRVVSQAGPGKKLTTYNYGKGKAIISGEVVDALGNKRVFKFAKDGSKTVEIDSLNRARTTYFNTKIRKVNKIVDRMGRVTKLFHDSEGNLVKTIGPTGKVKTFTYGGPYNKITKLTNGNVTTKFAYDKLGNLTSMEFEDGRRFLYRYDRNGRLVKTITPLGKITAYTYGKMGRIASRIDPMGNVTKYHFDLAGRMTQIVSPDKTKYTFAYDNSDNLVEITDELGRKLKAEYDGANRLIATIDARGAKTVFRHNEMGLLEYVENALGERLSYEYDANGNKTKTILPTGKFFTYKYDPLNRLTEESQPNGQKKAYKYDPLGKIIALERADGLKEHFKYDKAGRLTLWIKPQETIRYKYGNGLITQIDGKGNKTIAKFDKTGNMIEKSTPAGIVTKFIYDKESRLLEERTNTGKVLRYSYDKAGNLIETKDDKSTLQKFTYDANGRVIEQEESGLKWQYKYNPAGQLIKVVNPEGGEVKFTHNKQGDVTSVTDPKGFVEKYRYNLGKKLIARTYADGTRDYTEFNKLSRIKERRFPNGTKLEYSYDANGNPTKVTDDKKVLALYTYDNLGRIIRAQNEWTSLEYKYGKLNRVIQEKDLKRGKTLNFTYDRNGQLRTISDADKLLRTFAYNRLGLVKGILDENGGTYKIRYNKNKKPVRIAYPDGTDLRYKYSNGKIVRILALSKKRKKIFAAKYEYDSHGRLVKEQSSSGSKKYFYDKFSRLAKVTEGTGISYVYKYDKNDNRTLEKTGKNTKSYTYDNMNRIQKIGRTKCAYDKKGNLKKKGSYEFTYNGFDQLTTIKQNGKANLEIVYDALGRKYYTVKNGKKTYHRYLHFHPLLDEDESGHLKRSIVQSPELTDIDSPLGILAGAKAFYPIQDAKKNIVRIIDKKAGEITSIDYEPFGKPKKGMSAKEEYLAFAGRPYDPETGLSDLRYRHYDTDTGRFLTKDPLHPITGLNAYVYPANDPVQFRDPLGLFGFSGSASTPTAGSDSGTALGAAGPGPGPGPSTGTAPSTTASTTTTTAATAKTGSRSYSVLQNRQPDLLAVAGVYIGIPLAAKALSKIFNKDLSTVVTSFVKLPYSISGSLTGKLVGVGQKIAGVGDGPFVHEDEEIKNPTAAQKEQLFKMDILAVYAGDMSTEEFKEKWDRVESIDSFGFCEYNIKFKGSEKATAYSACKIQQEIDAAEASATEAKAAEEAKEAERRERMTRAWTTSSYTGNPYMDFLFQYTQSQSPSITGGAPGTIGTPTETPSGTRTITPGTITTPTRGTSGATGGAYPSRTRR